MKAYLSLLFFTILTLQSLQKDTDGWDGYYKVYDKQTNQRGISSKLKYDETISYFMSNQNHKVIKDLTFELNYDSNTELTFKIYDHNAENFILPYKDPFPFTKDTGKYHEKEAAYRIIYPNNNEDFSLKIQRKDTNQTIFDTTGTYLKYADYYREINTLCKEEKIFGMGERRMEFLFTSGKYSIYNQDQFVVMEQHQPGYQLYGNHPMWLQKTQGDRFHIGFLRNSFGMRFDYQENQYMSFKVGGGIIEMKFFFGDRDPEEVVKAYHNYVNGFTLMPFWSMGIHICRYGIPNSNEWVNVWMKANENKFPFDTLWSDIDYMYKYENFGIDSQRFNVEDMKRVTDITTNLGVHWIPILDAGIGINSPFAAIGKQEGVFIQSGKYIGKTLIGKVWPGDSYFVDYNNPKSIDFWKRGIQNIYQSPNNGPTPSGIWIDMNEVSNFINGEVYQSGKTSNNDDIFQQIWSPINTNYNERCISMSALHYNKQDGQYFHLKNKDLTEYEMHNTEGLFQGIAVYKALKSLGHELPFILSRSTMFGQGKYTAHWTGDNEESWQFFQFAVAEILNFQLFGMPFVGTDICGFKGNPIPELCARWLQLGTFYPFSRSHKMMNYGDHYPWSFPNNPYVLESSTKSARLRYSLLKYYYHQFIKANGTGTIFKPVFFEYPSDSVLYSNDNQFMIGKELLFAPVLSRGDYSCQCTKHSVYIPDDIYYDYYNGNLMHSGDNIFNVPFSSTIPIYIRGGKLIYSQNAESVLRARFLNNHFQLKAALGSDNKAQGTILSLTNYNSDSSIIQQCVQNNCILNIFVHIYKEQNNNVINIQIKKSQPQTVFSREGIYIDEITLYGYQIGSIKTIKFDDPWLITNEASKTIYII